MPEQEDREAFLQEYGVSRETIERLDRFTNLLRKWNARINLVSHDSLSGLWSRHIGDSAQLMAHGPTGAKTWADIGSGGGFPGVVLAILALECRPDMVFHLVESDQRKAAFLATALREAGAKAHVHAERAETLEPLGADIVSARALASVRRLVPHLKRHLGRGGVAILPKGANWSSEVEEALEKYDFTYDKKTSRTDADGAILILRNIDHAAEG